MNKSKVLKCDLDFANINNCEDQSSVIPAEIVQMAPSVVMTSMIHDNSLFLQLVDRQVNPPDKGLYKCPINSNGDLGICVAEPLVTDSNGSLSFVGKYAYQGGGSENNGDPGAIVRYDYNPESSNIFSNKTYTHLFEASGEIPKAWRMFFSIGVGDYFITADQDLHLYVAKSDPLTGLLEITDTVNNYNEHIDIIAHNGSYIYGYMPYGNSPDVTTSSVLMVHELDKITGKIVATNSQSLPASALDFGFGYAYYVDGSTNDVYTCKVSNKGGLLFDCKESLDAGFKPLSVAVYKK